ncbi:expressed unknown protein [Seminavis robusta]|uniref:Uncharacterized protein n=1 Tax=Seminavis robusta TaxID=568900 RepID=A0A9N8E0M5_9STRA|nr:expressed unknown protein [Seminavis robusta]|eukprot:Sro530_g161310.1 n/a (295) ;mRNA; f:53709-54683
MRLHVVILASIASVSAGRPWGAHSAAFKSSAFSVPAGGSLDSAKSAAIAGAVEKIEDLRATIVDGGSVVPELGSKSSAILAAALEDFTSNADEEDSSSTAYDRGVDEIAAAVDSQLQVLYLRQLALLRENALQKYRTDTKTSGSSDYEAMLQADAQFAREAEDATREGSDWSYTAERSFLQAVMNNIAESGKKVSEIQQKSAQQQQTAMQFLQSQQQMIQQLQMQLYGQSSPWNVGVAYRIPDTNFNLQGSYQQGRANVQLSCVPDEYAPMLGPNGFTNGVGPGNLGLSLNLSV